MTANQKKIKKSEDNYQESQEEEEMTKGKQVN